MLRELVFGVSLCLCGLPAWAGDDAAGAIANQGAEAASAPQEVDLAAAEEIYQDSCQACHGNRAQGVASYPRISDKEPDYIVEMLRRYRAGERIGPNSILMIENAKPLSDEEIASLAVYVASAFD